MRRLNTFWCVVLWLLAMFVWSFAHEAVTAIDVSAKVSEARNFDPKGIRTFSLHLGKENGTVTVLADDDLPITKLLATGKVRLRVDALPTQPERLER